MMARGTYRIDTDKVLRLAFKKGWSEHELLKKAGLSPHLIYRSKRGQTHYPSTIHVLALTLGVEPEEITIKEK